MRLSQPQLSIVQRQINISAIPETEETVGKLSELFGDHTFLVNEEGLYIFEQNPSENGQDQYAQLVAIALRSEENRQEFVLQSKPQEMNIKMKVETGELFEDS